MIFLGVILCCPSQENYIIYFGVEIHDFGRNVRGRVKIKWQEHSKTLCIILHLCHKLQMKSTDLYTYSFILCVSEVWVSTV